MLLRRVARRLDLPVQAAVPAVEAGLVEFGTQVRFRHPLARAAAYRSAPVPVRQDLHAALAEETDPAADPDRRVGLAREAGALDQLPVMLGALGTAVAWAGDFAAAAALDDEATAICEATGSRAAPFTALLLACWRGREAEAVPLIEATITGATADGQGIAVAYAHWVAAILHNGLRRYGDALAAARQAGPSGPRSRR